MDQLEQTGEWLVLPQGRGAGGDASDTTPAAHGADHWARHCHLLSASAALDSAISQAVAQAEAAPAGGDSSGTAPAMHLLLRSASQAVGLGNARRRSAVLADTVNVFRSLICYASPPPLLLLSLCNTYSHLLLTTACLTCASRPSQRSAQPRFCSCTPFQARATHRT